MHRKLNELEKVDKPILWFRLTYSLQGMFSEQDLEEPVIAYLPNETEISFWMRTFPEEKKIKPQFCCTTCKKRSVNHKLYKHFQDFAKKVLPRDSSSTVILPYQVAVGAEIDKAGNMPDGWAVNLDIFPSNFQNLYSEMYTELAEILKTYVCTLRWAQNASSKQSPFGHISFEWSFDKQIWSSMPHNFSFSIEQHTGLQLKSLALITKLWTEQRFEPLAHELLREAFDVLHTNPRSALLIGATALETGLKHYINFLLPNSNILLEKMPSPSPAVMLRDVIPELQVQLGKDTLSTQQQDFELLRKWTLLRNETAHGIQRKIDSIELKEFLQFIERLLYRLDERRGESWAAPFSQHNQP